MHGSAHLVLVDDQPGLTWSSWDEAVEDFLATLGSVHSRVAYRHDLTEALGILGLPVMVVDIRRLMAYRSWVNEQPWLPSTRHAKVVRLRGFLRWVGEMGGMEITDRLLRRALPLPSVRGRKIGPVPNDDELGRMLASCARWWHRPVIAVAIATGLRRSELRSLRVADVFLGSAPSISVWGKGAKQRTVPLREDVADILRAWVTESGLDKHPHWPLFPGLCRADDGTPLSISSSTLYNIVSRTARYAGLTASPHAIRRAAACRMEDAGMTLDDIREVMGHEDAATTQRYLEHNRQRQIRAALPPLPLPPS